jgi:lipoic acid synthetase
MNQSQQIKSQWHSEIKSLPSWLRPSIGKASDISTVQRIIKQRQIHTICEEGRCPNRAECYSKQTATFLLMGNVCTRACAFCQVDKGHAPLNLDPDEPQKVADAVKLLGLRYVVLTAVARDDLADGGASWFVKVMTAIRTLNPNTQIEVLTPDFWSGKDAILSQRERVATLVKAKPACFNHNLETVERLQNPVRRGAKYHRSLRVLELVKEFDADVPTKSGLILGLGETLAEVIQTMKDLRKSKCDRLTIGQYLRPSLAHLPVQKYWSPAEFEQLGEIAKALGFSQVNSAPLVRSSYHAGEC